ncbi:MULTISPECIES: hypothetical protein, partial [unclassified Nonomuraea]|uniref:hypothetical protein n=1 Tax=unclassified Nonomuraea TaxID=2593643 RepID=UPI003406D6AF
GRGTGRRRTVAVVIPSDPTAPADGIDAVTALLDASRRYATHVRLLVDQLADAHLVGEDAARVQDDISARPWLLLKDQQSLPVYQAFTTTPGLPRSVWPGPTQMV